VVTVASKAEISVAERNCLVIAVIFECHVVSVVVVKTVLLIDVMKEGSFVGITELVMADLKEVNAGLQIESVAVGRIVMKTVGTKAEIVVETTKWETAELQWRAVAEGTVQMIAENKLIAGWDWRLVAVELCADFVAESTDAAGELRRDVHGSSMETVDPLVAVETCGSVGCLLKFPFDRDEIVDDENAAPCDDLEKRTEKQKYYFRY
jgi:hypothetical protein